MKEFVIDLFCGAGGTSTGIHLSKTNSKVVFCVNHDRVAIASHKANHPHAKHLVEDIRNPEVLFWLKLRVNALRKLYPGCIITIWASLECTNYSKAKGGLPRDADSRTLAEHLFMYLDAINPDYLMIENVMEFMSWGKMRIQENISKSKKDLFCALKETKESTPRFPVYHLTPISKQKGIDYLKWVDRVKSYGYNFDWKKLNSADYGALTSRSRYFGQFAKNGLPVVWPEQTHCKKISKNAELFQKLEPYRQVKEVLQFDIEGKSIFNQKKDKAEKTLKRIYAGLLKHVANGDKHFLQSYYGNGNAHSIYKPCPTVTTKDRFGFVKACFIDQQYGNSKPISVNSIINTLTTNPNFNLVTADYFIYNPQYNSAGNSIHQPSPTIIARQDKSPLGLVSLPKGYSDNWIIKDTDSETTVKIKKFMAHYGISDIKMRGLNVNELKMIQGFPRDYILLGTQTDQKKFIGNSVEVTVATALFEAHDQALQDHFETLKIAA